MLKSMDIIYEDNDILLCRKPAGMATQTKRLGQQDMESLLKNYRAKKGEQPYVGIVHRLDQPVEGLMVFGKNPKATAELSKQIQQRMIGKYYYAVSAYAPEKEEGVLEDYLLTDKKSNHTTVVELHDNSKAKRAKLEYRVVANDAEATLFDIKLHTGRQHQIRVQMAHMGCALVGDTKYGNSQSILRQQNESEANSYRQGLALCSYRLEFLHPTTKKPMDYRITPQGEEFRKFAESFPADKPEKP